MIVLDASAWVVALVDAGAPGDATREVLRTDPDWLAPAHAPLEVLRTLWRYESRGLLSSAATERLAAEVGSAHVRYAGPETALLAYVWQHRHDVSPYDAPYLGLAARQRVPLVTHDRRLAQAGAALGIEVVTP